MSHGLQQKPKEMQRSRTAPNQPVQHDCDMTGHEKGPATRRSRPMPTSSVPPRIPCAIELGGKSGGKRTHNLDAQD
jgi:hypothetical protein